MSRSANKKLRLPESGSFTGSISTVLSLQLVLQLILMRIKARSGGSAPRSLAVHVHTPVYVCVTQEDESNKSQWAIGI